MDDTVNRLLHTLAYGHAPSIVHELTCPECGEAVWDGPHGSKLAKCWNTEGHADGGTLAFDTMGDD